MGATEPQVYGHSIWKQGNHGRRLLSTKSIYRNLFVHPEMETWVERRKPQTQDKFRKVSVVVLSDTNFWKNLDMCSRIFESVLQDLCVSDGMKGGTPSSTICAWVWTRSTVSRLTNSRKLRVANCMSCSWNGGMCFTHLCTVLTSTCHG